MDDDWILYSVTSFAFAVIFGFCYIRHIFTFFERNKIPSATPSPTFPFGNMYNVIFQKTPMFMQLWKFYNKFKRKKYSSVGFYIFLEPAILIVNPSDEFVLNNNDCFVSNANFSNSISKSNIELLCKVSTKIPKIWFKLLLKFQKEDEVNFTDLMNRKFTKVATQQFFDFKISQQPQKNFRFLERENVLSICHTLLALCYPFTKISKLERGDIIFEDVVQNKLKLNIFKEDDLFQILIHNGLSNEEMRKVIFMMMYNLKRSNNLVLFTLYEMCISKEIQDELREEIISLRKTDSEITYNDLNKLVYLEAVVCETLRKYPFEPFFYKICKRNFKENDVILTRDLLVFVSTFGIHHDAQNYVNPESFDPDRFSEENRKSIAATKYLPFGCKNQDEFDVHYVKMIMKMVLVEVLSTVKLSLNRKSPKMILFDPTFFKSLQFKEDLWLKIYKI